MAFDCNKTCHATKDYTFNTCYRSFHVQDECIDDYFECLNSFVISNSGELSKSDSFADRANPHPSRLPAAEVDGEGSGNSLIFSFWQDKN